MRQFFSKIMSMIGHAPFGIVFINVLRSLGIIRTAELIVDIFNPKWTDDDVARSKKYFEANAARLNALKTTLVDELSQKTLNAFLEYRSSGNSRSLRKVERPSSEQYFMEKPLRKSLLPLENECFVDCGAYTGDTLKSFIANGGTFENYYAFEPNKKIYEVFHKKHTADNIHLFNCCLGDTEKYVNFGMDNYSGASKIDGPGDTEAVKMMTLDSVLKNKKITFIKMDIEGAELQALHGAADTIRDQCPTLAICVYHKLEDLLDIFDYLSSFKGAYAFYLRHYSYLIYETVLYAIPRR